MRIKIIGDNNCARATRHLLRLAGFAVTEFLPPEVIMEAPHSGYAITIETFERAPSGAQTLNTWAPSGAHTRLAPAPQPLTPASAPKTGAAAGVPASEPDHSTHGQPAAVHGEASPSHGGASSPAYAKASAGAPAHDEGSAGRPTYCEGWAGGNIHFDSTDGELEAAILRHVARLAKAPVMVDRPGGVVHSERELRIIVPATGDAKADESAAVAVEFGVLRGLLDLTRRPSHSELRGGSADGSRGKPASGDKASEVAGKSGVVREGGNKWWIFGFVLVATVSALFGARLIAAPRVKVAVGGNPAQAKTYATAESHITRSSVLRPTAFAKPALAAPEPQGQFATGQAVKIFDGANTMVVDPCKAQTKLFASINQTANAQLVAGAASKKIYICSIHVVVAAATSVALVEGTGAVCATGTAGVSGFGGATAATGWSFMANGGIALGSGAAAVGAEGTSADNLCLFNSGSGQVSGGISYVVQ